MPCSELQLYRDIVLSLIGTKLVPYDRVPHQFSQSIKAQHGKMCDTLRREGGGVSSPAIHWRTFPFLISITSKLAGSIDLSLPFSSRFKKSIIHGQLAASDHGWLPFPLLRE